MWWRGTMRHTPRHRSDSGQYHHSVMEQRGQSHRYRPNSEHPISGLVTRYEITPAYLRRGTSDDDRVVSLPVAARY
jgi:hypothetical protein